MAPGAPASPSSPPVPKPPIAPTGPDGPGMPVAPVSPVGPVAPRRPLCPASPMAPVVPTGPRSPLGPRPPWAPFDPVTPSKPVSPGGPNGPIGPENPVLPMFPVTPVIPAFTCQWHYHQLYEYLYQCNYHRLEVTIQLSGFYSALDAETETAVTCERKLFRDNSEIVSVFYFTRRWSHITTSSETEIKLSQPLKRVVKLFQNYFSDIEHAGKYSRPAIILRNNFEINSGKFPRVKIELFQTDVDEG